MKILTTPWKDDLLEMVFQSKKSIKITSPFVKYNVCKELLDAKNSFTKFELITSFKLMNIYSGSLDISAIESVLDKNGIVKNFSKLHSKIYLFDDTSAVITSGNLTNGGLLNNFEYGIFLNERNIVQKITNDFNSISTNENTGVIKRTDLSIVKKILANIPKVQTSNIPHYKVDTPEENFDIIETSSNNISSSLTGWKLDVFNCLVNIQKQEFTLEEIYSFEKSLQKLHPENNNVKDKIRQQLQILRDIGLLEFLGSGNYKKLWK